MIKKILNFINAILTILIIFMFTWKFINNIRELRRLREENKILEWLLEMDEQDNFWNEGDYDYVAI